MHSNKAVELKHFILMIGLGCIPYGQTVIDFLSALQFFIAERRKQYAIAEDPKHLLMKTHINFYGNF